MAPQVAAVVPAYRAEAFVAKALESLKAQDGITLEIVVAVDGDDRATAAAAEAVDGVRVLVSADRLGVSAMRNLGLAATGAPFVYFLDADDWCEGPLLAGLAAALDAHGADIAAGPATSETPDGRRGPVRCARLDPTADPLPQALAGNLFWVGRLMFRRTLLERLGGFREGLHKGEDFELVVRAAIRGARFAASEGGVGVYFQHAATTRLSAQQHRATLRAGTDNLARLVALARAEGRMTPEAEAGFRRGAYAMLRNQARHAERETYARSLRLYRDLGGRGHYGSLPHRLGARLLGLRGKEWLALRLAALKRRLAG